MVQGIRLYLLLQYPRKKKVKLFITIKQGNPKSLKFNYWLSKFRGEEGLGFRIQGLVFRVEEGLGEARIPETPISLN